MERAAPQINMPQLLEDKIDGGSYADGIEQFASIERSPTPQAVVRVMGDRITIILPP